MANGQMKGYLLKPEVLALLESETDPRHRIILDLIWSTGGRISEVLALTKADFVQELGKTGLWLQTLHSKPGRRSKASLARSPRRFIPIHDELTLTQLSNWCGIGKIKLNERMFSITRQAVSYRLSKRVWLQGGPEFPISTSTLRRSFAIHLLLHGRPLRYVAELLGVKDISSIEAYERVLRLEGDDLLKGIEFHN